MKINAAGSSEIMVKFYQSTWLRAQNFSYHRNFKLGKLSTTVCAN
jgi:hypothetical protein